MSEGHSPKSVFEVLGRKARLERLSLREHPSQGWHRRRHLLLRRGQVIPGVLVAQMEFLRCVTGQFGNVEGRRIITLLAFHSWLPAVASITMRFTFPTTEQNLSRFTDNK